MLVRMDLLLKDAQLRNYGVVAPGVLNSDTIKAVFEVARELRAPVIINVYEGELDMLEEMAHMVHYYNNIYYDVIASLNLDHGKTLEGIIKALDCGFTSVMIDYSDKPYEENVRMTQEVVRRAHMVNAAVEAELGHVGIGIEYKKDRDAGLTEAKDVKDFIEKTNVDCLAVAIGTAHGRYIGTPTIDFERLKAIRAITDVPLVLHGGSSSGDDNLRKAVELGISKVNLFTDLCTSGANKVKEGMEHNEFYGLHNMYMDGIVGYKEILIKYIKLFGSDNKF